MEREKAISDLLEEMGLLNGELKTVSEIHTSTYGVWCDYQKELESLSQDKILTHLKKKITLFGAYTSYQAGDVTGTVNMGMYNTAAIEDLMDWQEKGIGSVLIKELGSQKKVNEFLADFKSELSWGGKYDKEVDILLNGGNILGMETSDLVKAIDQLEKEYENYIDDKSKEKYFGDELNLIGIFQKR